MYLDLWAWIILTIIVCLLVHWLLRQCGSDVPRAERSFRSSRQQNENLIRCHGALQTILSSALPSLQRTIDLWHQTTARNIPSCTGIQPKQCPPNKKPSAKHSCPGCIDWMKAIEAEVYPLSVKGSLQWRNANPALFYEDPLEVMKLFSLRLPEVNETYSTVGDFDAASVLMIMARFAPFHNGTQAVHDQIMKVSRIRNYLSHLKVSNNLHLDNQTFEAYWTDITDLVNQIQSLGKNYFTTQTAKGMHYKLAEIKTGTISPRIDEEASRFLKEYAVLATMRDEAKQSAPFDLPSCQKRLKAVYKTNRRGIGFIPGFPKEFSSDEFFVDLKLAQEQKSPTKVKYVSLKTYTDLLHIQDKIGQKLNHVLVSGRGGSGKRTLVSRVAYQWATAESGTACNENVLSERFQLLFLLDIRRFKPTMDLVDAIKDQLLRHLSKCQLHEYLVTNADKCLFLFDGYDELSSDEVVFGSEHLCSSYVIVTTRPNKLDLFCDKYQGYVKVNLNGFSEDSINKFVCKFFGDDKQSRELLNLLENSMFCKLLAQYPLLLAMLCIIYKDQNGLPDTITSLFTSVIDYLVRHWKGRVDSNSSLEEFKIEVGLGNIMIQLGRVSLNGLMDTDTKLIFNEDEFESPNTVHVGYALGLLSNARRYSGFDSICDVLFIHKTFQEYCAAVFLVYLVESDPIKFKDIVYRMNLSDMEYVLRFSCGLSLKAAECILAFISDMNSRSRESIHAMMKHAFSSPSYVDEDLGIPVELMNEVCPKRRAIMLLYEAEIRHGFNTQLHGVLKRLLSCFIFDISMIIFETAEVINYFFNNNSANLKGAWLDHVELVGLVDPLIRDTDLHVKRLSKMPNLSVLFCFDIHVPVSVRFIHLISSDIPQLKEFHINTIDAGAETDPELLVEVFQWAKSLNEFSVRSLRVYNCAMNSAIVHVRMSSYLKLKYISFTNTSLRESDVELLCVEIVKSCRNAAIEQLPLIELDLSMNHLGSASSKLAEAVEFMSSLKTMTLKQAGLTPEHFKVLGPSLSHLVNLENLDLSDNFIGSAIQAIIQGISKSKLKYLDLSNTRLSVESKRELTKINLPGLEYVY